jgi:hypothetical protein
MRLDGHAAESHNILHQLNTAARKSHLLLERYVETLNHSQDLCARNQACFIADVQKRDAFLTQACTALSNAQPIIRPIVMLRYLDVEILKETLHGYSIGFVFNADLVFWGTIGAIFAILLLYLPSYAKKRQ